MKKQNTLFLLKKYSIFLIFLTLWSCSKSLDETSPENIETTLTLAIDGVSSPNINFNTRTLNTAEINNDGVINKTSTSSNDLTFDIISAQNNIGSGYENPDKNAEMVNNTLSRNIRTVSTMVEGVKYRFLLYNKASGRCEASFSSTSGKVGRINVTEGTEYYWYAYSFNSTDSISEVDVENPIIETPTDKPLLYASGVLTPQRGNNAVPITFDHKLTQLKVEIDARGMFANITELSATFLNEALTTSEFNIRTGQKTGALKPMTVENLIFKNENEGSTRVKYATYYTANENLKYYDVKVNSLSVQYPNNTVENLTAKLPNAGTVRFSTYSASNAGNILLGKLKLWLVLPTKKVLSIGYLDGSGYAAEAGRVSGNFLRSTYNFSPTSDYLKVQSLEFEEINLTGGRLATRLADPANYPDVLVIGIFSNINATDYTVLNKYLQRGGVAFLMTETVNTDLRNFFRTLLGDNNLTLTNNDIGGSVYKLANVDPDVLDGVFGDVRGLYWGQDRSATQYLTNYSGTDLVIYTQNSANYYVPTNNGPTMFRHKRLNLFFVGDTGFLANNQVRGTLAEGYYNSYPFSTVGGSGADKDFPVGKLYGHYTVTGSPEYFTPIKNAGFFQANSIIFGNALAWLLERSHFAGVDRTP